MAAASDRAGKKKASRDAYTLHTFPQPLFMLEELDDMHLLVGGGGGSAKTGILNQLHIAQITPPVSSTGVPYGIKLLSAIDTGTAPAMSASTAEFLRQSPQERAHMMRQFQESFPRLQQAAGGMPSNNNELLGSCRNIIESCSKLLAVSQAGSTALYFLTKGMAPPADGTSAEQPTWFVTHVANVNTDETPGDPYQRVVKICRVLDQSSTNSSRRSGSSLSDFFFFTGGSDGSVKGFVLFAVDALNPKQSIKIDPTWVRGQLHREVISLSISSDSACVVSCGREGRAFILSATDGSLLKEIPVACVPSESNAPADANSAAVERRYLCCAVRFNPAQSSELFVAWIPVNKYQRNMPSYIMRLRLLSPTAPAGKPSAGTEQKYQLQIERTKSLGTNPVHIDGLEVSRDGRLLSVGLIGGNVLQLDTNTLNTRSTSRAPHDAPVNRFLYASNMIVGENTLMSVGIDNKLVVHKPAGNQLLTVKRFLLTWILASLVLYLGFHMLTTYKGLPTSTRKSASSRFASFVPSRSIDSAAAVDSLNDTSPVVEKQDHHHKHALHRHDDTHHHHHHQHGHSHENTQIHPHAEASATTGVPIMAIPRVDLPHSLPEHTADLNNVPQPSISVTPTAASASVPPLAMPYFAASATTRTAAPSVSVVVENAQQHVLPTVSGNVQRTDATLQPIDAAKTMPTTSVGDTHVHDHHRHGDDHAHHDHDHDHHGHDHAHGQHDDHDHHHHHHHHHDKKKEYEASFAQFQQHRPAPATMVKQAAPFQTATHGGGGLFGILRAPKITATTSTTVTTGSVAPLQPTVTSVQEPLTSQPVVISTTELSPSVPGVVSTSVVPTPAEITPTSTAAIHPLEDRAVVTATASTAVASEIIDEMVKLETTPSPTPALPTTTEAAEPVSASAPSAAPSTRDIVVSEPAVVEGAKTTVGDQSPAVAASTAENTSVVVDNAAPLGSTLSDSDSTTPAPEAAIDLDAGHTTVMAEPGRTEQDSVATTSTKSVQGKETTDNTKPLGVPEQANIAENGTETNELPTLTTSGHVQAAVESTTTLSSVLDAENTVTSASLTAFEAANAEANHTNTNEQPTGGDVDGSPPTTSPLPVTTENFGQNLSEQAENIQTDADIFDTHDEGNEDDDEDRLGFPLDRPGNLPELSDLPPIPLIPVDASTEAADTVSIPPVIPDRHDESATDKLADLATLDDVVKAAPASGETESTKPDVVADDAEQKPQGKFAAFKNKFAHFLDQV